MSATFIIKPLQIIKTDRFLNQTVAVEGYISFIEYNGDMVLIKIKDQAEDLDIIFLKEQIKIFGSQLRKIKNLNKKIRVSATGKLQTSQDKAYLNNNFELLIENFSLENKCSVFSDALNTNSAGNWEKYKYNFSKR